MPRVKSLHLNGSRMEFQSSFAKTIWPTLVLMTCTAASVWIAMQSPWMMVRAVLGGCALLFVYLLLSLLRDCLGRGAILSLDEQGIHDRRLHVGVVDWTDIQTIQIPKVGGDIMCIVTKDDSKYLDRLRAPKRILLEMSKTSWGTPFVITFAALKPSLNEATAYIKAVQPGLIET